jgi:hypothetical protein
VALQQIFLLQRTRKRIATNTWLQEQTLQLTNMPNATNTSLQGQILQRTKIALCNQYLVARTNIATIRLVALGSNATKHLAAIFHGCHQ